MKSKYITVAIIILIIIGGFFIFSNKSGENGKDIEQTEIITIMSDDKGAMLEIPKSAIPEGVLLDDIMMTRVEDPDAEEGSVTYALAPEGLTFNKPVSVQITVDTVGNSIPEFIHTTGDTVEPLENVVMALDLDSGSIKASGEITHFSEVKVIFLGFFEIEIVDPPALEYFIDESFNVTAKVRNLADTIYYNKTKKSGEKMLGSWSLEGTLKGVDETIFNPGKVTDVPRLGSIEGGSYEVTKTFRCVSFGTTSVEYEIWLSFIAGVYYSFDNDTANYDISHSKIVKVNTSAITCKSLVLDTSAGPGTGLQGASHDPDDLNCPDAKYLSVDLGGFSKEVHKLKDGKCYPQEQFVPVSDPDKCLQDHYHVELRSLGQNVRSDSQPCGAAVKPDIVASGTVWITSEQINAIIDFDAERRDKQ